MSGRIKLVAVVLCCLAVALSIGLYFRPSNQVGIPFGVELGDSYSDVSKKDNGLRGPDTSKGETIGFHFKVDPADLGLDLDDVEIGINYYFGANDSLHMVTVLFLTNSDSDNKGVFSAIENTFTKEYGEADYLVPVACSWDTEDYKISLTSLEEGVTLQFES